MRICPRERPGPRKIHTVWFRGIPQIYEVLVVQVAVQGAVRCFGAQEALSCGLVNHVVALEELLPLTQKIAGKIMRNSSVAISKAITAINDNYTDGINGFETEINQFGACFSTEDFKEGTQAFLGKRKASFPGK